MATKFQRGVDFDVEMNRAICFITDFENALEGRFPNSDSRYLHSLKELMCIYCILHKKVTGFLLIKSLTRYMKNIYIFSCL